MDAKFESETDTEAIAKVHQHYFCLYDYSLLIGLKINSFFDILQLTKYVFEQHKDKNMTFRQIIEKVSEYLVRLFSI